MPQLASAGPAATRLPSLSKGYLGRAPAAPVYWNPRIAASPGGLCALSPGSARLRGGRARQMRDREPPGRRQEGELGRARIRAVAAVEPSPREILRVAAGVLYRPAATGARPPRTGPALPARRRVHGHHLGDRLRARRSGHAHGLPAPARVSRLAAKYRRSSSTSRRRAAWLPPRLTRAGGAPRSVRPSVRRPRRAAPRCRRRSRPPAR
jgi:hypothetical protein